MTWASIARRPPAPPPVAETAGGARIVSIQVGTPRSYTAPDDDGTYESAIDKRPVAGRVHLGVTGLAGDAVADRRAHGGPDQAMLLYSVAHYPAWEAEGLGPLQPGAFGENLSVSGADERTVAIGDRWALGDVVIEVSKPRTPCNRLALRHRRPDLIRRVHETGRSGWYVRVLNEGWLEAGTSMSLVSRPHADWTVRRVAQVMADRQNRHEEALALARLPELAADWRYRLAKGG